MATPAHRRQIKPMYLVVGIVVVVAAVVLMLVLRSGGGGNLAVPSVSPGAAAPLATPAPTPEQMEVFQIFEGRDPFRPLIGTETPAPSGSPAATAAPSGGATATATPAASSTTTQGAVRVTLIDVTDDQQSATVQVGSNVHQGVRPGQAIESGVVMDAITSASCARFHRDSKSFTLCEGEQVLK